MAEQSADDKDKKKKPIAKMALGRGLGALLTSNTTAEAEDDYTPTVTDYSDATIGSSPSEASALRVPAPNQVAFVPVSAITPNPYQPRTDFAEEALNELADSIRTQGIIQPLTVRMLEPGSYQLIAGERRLRASKLAGLTEVPAYIRTANDEQMMEMALVENLQRDDLNPMEIALSYQRLMDECNLIIQEVADRVGKKRATVNNYLRLLKLPPDIQAAVRDNRLTMGHARALLGLTKTEDQLVLFKECLAKEYSVREIEKQVQRWIELDTAPPQAPEAQPLPDAYTIQLRAVEQQLESRFGTRVLIQADPQRRGEIRLKFFSGDDLNRLLELLNT